MRYRFFVLCVAIFYVTPVLSQNQRHWQLTLSDGKVFSKIQLNHIKDTLLIFADSIGNHTIFIDSIVELRFVRETKFWKSVKTGAMVGSAVGVIGGAVFSKPGGAIVGMDKPGVYRPLAAIGMGIGLGVVGGLLGGVEGVIGGTDDVFDLSYMPPAGKLTTVRVVIAREKEK